MKIKSLVLSCTAIALLGTCLSVLGQTQTETPTRARVTVTHVKPDMLTTWIDLQKNEVVPALKKAGEKTRTVYVTSIFGSSFEYLAISPIENMAQFDGQGPLVKALDNAGAARLNDKLRKCVDSSNSYMIIRQTDISNVLDASPNMLVTARYRIAQGKMDEFHSLMKSEVLPIYQKAKMGLIVNTRGPGANVNDVTVSTAYPKFADMDKGPFLTQQLGADGAARLNAKFANVRTLIDVMVRRKVADLSF